jgi:hypothetical protein
MPTISVTPSVRWRLTGVEALSGYRLKVRFQDGLEGLVDMSALVRSENAGVFAALRGEAVFRRVFLECGAVTWPGGDRPGARCNVRRD